MYWEEKIGVWAGRILVLIIIGVLLETMLNFDTVKAIYLGLPQ